MNTAIQTAALLLIASGAYTQNVPFSIGLQLNPIIHYNNSTSSNPAMGNMKLWNTGSQTGLELNYRYKDKWILSPMIKYYRKSQKIEQDDFSGYLNDGSKTWMKYTYESIDVGLLVKYRLATGRNNSPFIVAGISYSMADVCETNEGYHLYGDNPQTVHLGDIAYKYSPNNLGATVNMWHVMAGMRNTACIKKIGVFEYGLLFYLPASKMPKYRYDQTLTTDDKGLIHSDVEYRSRQYSIETSIIYHLFNFNRKLKLVHPKKTDRRKPLY